ncbi:MAG: hypothetical protein Q8P79_01385 [Nanoarchaeota archaeon]|nr:hypothetical protein [Nanoarchaeota archaeon]
MQDLQTLLDTLINLHEKGLINGDERVRLHQMLKEKYSYGNEMPEYKCPECKKPMFYTWPNGPVCIESEGGCGYTFN